MTTKTKPDHFDRMEARHHELLREGVRLAGNMQWPYGRRSSALRANASAKATLAWLEQQVAHAYGWYRQMEQRKHDSFEARCRADDAFHAYLRAEDSWRHVARLLDK